MLIEQALHLAKSPSFMDTLMKMEPLSVNLCKILDRSVEQYCRLKKDEQSQSQSDLLRSSFHLIQAENGTFFPASFLFAYF